MPTYEYACRSCGHHVEVVQSFTDEPLTVCPTCQGPMRKVFGSVGIVLKGSGFYKTDSRAASSRQGKPERGGDQKEQKETAATKETKETKEKAAGKTESAGSTGTASTSPGSSATPPQSAIG